MSYYQKILIDFKQGFYLYATLGIILSSCIGAAAAMIVLVNGHGVAEMFQLFLITCACMWFNTTVLATFSPKIVLNSLIVSVLLSTLLIIVHLII